MSPVEVRFEVVRMQQRYAASLHSALEAFPFDSPTRARLQRQCARAYEVARLWYERLDVPLEHWRDDL